MHIYGDVTALKNNKKVSERAVMTQEYGYYVITLLDKDVKFLARDTEGAMYQARLYIKQN